ncbi:MAG: SOS response-associated peptidase [Pseudomonadota bacterium]
MCGRFSQEATWQELRDHYALIPTQPALSLAARYNIGPWQQATIVRAHEQGREAVAAVFDLVPSHWKRPRKEKKFSTFNAKSETVTTLRSFKDAWAQGQRAVLPVDGFYEWPRPKRPSTPPFYVTASDGARLQLAALWSTWFNPLTKQIEETFAVLTCPPNADMASVPHHRSPVVIADDETETWLTSSPDDALTLLVPPRDGAFHLTRVTTYTNKIGHEGRKCIEGPNTLF